MRAFHKDSNGFGIAEVLIVVAAVSLVGLAGWMVWNKRQAASVNSYETCAKAGGAMLETYPPQCVKDGKSFTQKVETAASFQPTQNVMLEKSYNPPAGWKVEETSDNRVRLAGGKNNCYVDAVVLKAADAKKAEAAKFTANQFQRVLAGPVDKREYSFTKLEPVGRGSVVKVDGGNGVESYESLEVRVTGQGKTTRQTFVYIVGDGKYGQLQASCEGDDYTGIQMGDERGDDSQVIFGSIIPAIHFKVL